MANFAKDNATTSSAPWTGDGFSGSGSHSFGPSTSFAQENPSKVAASAWTGNNFSGSKHYGTPGTSRFVKDGRTNNQTAWEGPNMHSDALGFDVSGGIAFGIGELGGISHFIGRNPPVINH